MKTSFFKTLELVSQRSDESAGPGPGHGWISPHKSRQIGKNAFLCFIEQLDVLHFKTKISKLIKVL